MQVPPGTTIHGALVTVQIVDDGDLGGVYGPGAVRIDRVDPIGCGRVRGAQRRAARVRRREAWRGPKERAAAPRGTAAQLLPLRREARQRGLTAPRPRVRGR